MKTNYLFRGTQLCREGHGAVNTSYTPYNRFFNSTGQIIIAIVVFAMILVAPLDLGRSERFVIFNKKQSITGAKADSDSIQSSHALASLLLIALLGKEGRDRD